MPCPFRSRLAGRVAPLLCLLIVSFAACSQPPPPPPGTQRIDIVADTTLSAYPGEQDANLGGAPWLKAKSYQELFLVKPDTQALRGKGIERATLHIKVRGENPLLRVSVSTVPVDWQEGNGNSYDDIVKGAASFRHAAHDRKAWSGLGGDATAALFGIGGSDWHFADATPPDDNGWQQIAIDPRFVEACAAGTSHGLAIMDDVGSEWSRNARGELQYKLLPNRWVHSHESGASEAPYVTVKTAGKPPISPPDAGSRTALDWTPAGPPPGVASNLYIRETSTPQPPRWIELNRHRVALIYGVQRIDPYNKQPRKWRGLHLAPSGNPALHSARNEHIALGLVIDGDAQQLTAMLTSEDRAITQHLQIEQHDAWPVPVGKAEDKRWQTDALLPINHPAFQKHADALRHRIVTLYVGHDAPPGRHRLSLTLTSGNQTQTQAIDLVIHPFVLPDELSFVPQLNSYSQPQNPADTRWHRLAHEYRCVLNRLPYNWRGQPSPNHAPTRNADGSLDFDDWLDRVAPLLDGSAFADLPRGPVPVEFFYLPLSESWPVPFDPYYKSDGPNKYWIDDAVTGQYWDQFKNTTQSMIKALEKRGYDRTVFEFYLNNKIYYRRQGWDRTSAYWIFDEPVHTQDFWALRQYGLAFQQAARGLNLKTAYRIDASRPQLRRDLLDGVANTMYLAGDLENHLPVMREKRDRFDEVLFRYGSLPGMDKPLSHAVAWSLDAWRVGFDGVLPWQTIGRDWAWERADPQAVLYPGGPMGLDGPAPSLKLMALRRGQQDIEYLNRFGRNFTGGLDKARTWLEHSFGLRPDAFAEQHPDGLFADHLARLRFSVPRWPATKGSDFAPAPPTEQTGDAPRMPVVDRASAFVREPAKPDEHFTRMLDRRGEQ